MVDVVLAAALSAVFGAMGYLLVEFVIGPPRAAILRYRELRLALISDLIFYANTHWDQSRFQERSSKMRRYSTDLESFSREILPKWYKRRLLIREIDLDVAATTLIRLSNTQGADALKAATDACAALKLGRLF